MQTLKFCMDYLKSKSFNANNSIGFKQKLLLLLQSFACQTVKPVLKATLNKGLIMLIKANFWKTYNDF